MDGLSPFQTSNFTCAESNTNEKNLLFSLVCIRFGSCKVRRLKQALIEKKKNLFANVGKAHTACTLNSRLNLKTKEHCGTFWERPDKFCCEKRVFRGKQFYLKNVNIPPLTVFGNKNIIHIIP